MSFFSFKKNNNKGYSLVLNIGSGYVSGGIIDFTEKPGVNIHHYAKEIIPFQQDLSVSKHLNLMKSSLSTLAGNLQKEGLKKIKAQAGNKIFIDRVFYIFSSPWTISQTKNIRLKESKAFKITEDYLNKLIDQQEKSFQAEIGKAGKIIEKKIIQIKINGYVVNDYHNKLAKELELAVFFTIVEEEILHLVEGAVNNFFQVKDNWCHSLALPLFSVIRDLYPQQEDFIHIDISEEITDLSVTKDNVLISNASIPFGRNHFIRNLSIALNVSEEIADSMIKIHCTKDCDELATIRLGVAMDKLASEWLAKVSEVLNTLKEKIYVLEFIFLLAGSDIVPYLKEKLEKQDFKVLLIDNKKIKPPSVATNDLYFRLVLMFLDNIYKI